jgi:ABC-type nitrate/sulfonate/bicarbonate transport system substrate-binding protein
VGAHFTTLAWAQAHVDAVRRFESVMYQTAEWANRNHDKTADIPAAAAHIDPEIVRGAVRTDYSTHRDPSLMQPMIALAARYGGITPFPAEDLFFRGDRTIYQGTVRPR